MIFYAFPSRMIENLLTGHFLFDKNAAFFRKRAGNFPCSCYLFFSIYSVCLAVGSSFLGDSVLELSFISLSTILAMERTFFHASSGTWVG